MSSNLLVVWLLILTFRTVGKTQDIEPNSIYRCPPDFLAVGDLPVFLVAEKQPQFPGGHKAMMSFIYSNLKYSKEDPRQKVVYVEFIVDTTGQVRNPCILNNTTGSLTPLEQEVVRVVQLLPAWSPGVQRRKKVPVRMSFPVRF